VFSKPKEMVWLSGAKAEVDAIGDASVEFIICLIFTYCFNRVPDLFRGAVNLGSARLFRWLRLAQASGAK
jgi:hypothetical protein